MVHRVSWLETRGRCLPMDEVSPTCREYWDEIDAIGRAWLKEREPWQDGDDFQDWLHETLDGHEYVIYTFKALCIMLHTDNRDAWEEYGFEAGPMFDSQRAYCAMYQDVMDRLDYDPDDLDEEDEDANDDS